MNGGKVVTASVVFPHSHYIKRMFVATLLFWKDVTE